MQVQLLYLATYIPSFLKVEREDEGCVGYHSPLHFNAYVYFRKRISHKNEENAAFVSALNDLMWLQVFHNLATLQVYYLLLSSFVFPSCY